MNKKNYKALIFADPETTAYDGGEYCDFDTAADIVAGKDILLGVWNTDGSKLLAISGQNGLTINRSAETIEVNMKSVENGGWKDSLAGAKSWDVSLDAVWIRTDEAYKAMATAFNNSNPVCLVVYNGKTRDYLFGGLAVITEMNVEAPYDDSATQSISFSGKGALRDFTVQPTEHDSLPN